MITDITTYRDYFKWMAENHVAINGFVMGDLEMILNATRATLPYPCMWLEYPSIDAILTRGRIMHQGAFVIYTSIEVNDIAELATMAAMEEIVHDLLGKIKHDIDNRLTSILADSLAYDKVLRHLADNLHGWRVEFTSDAPVAWCYYGEKFGEEVEE